MSVFAAKIRQGIDPLRSKFGSDPQGSVPIEVGEQNPRTRPGEPSRNRLADHPTPCTATHSEATATPRVLAQASMQRKRPLATASASPDSSV